MKEFFYGLILVFPSFQTTWVVNSVGSLSGLHAECPRQRDRPAEDHGEGAGEKAAAGRVHLRRRPEPQNQRSDEGHEQPAARTSGG